jgi:hypothetical protein
MTSNSAIRVNDEGAAGQTQPPELSTGLGQCVIRHGYGQSKRFSVCVALILRSPSFQNRSTMMLLLTGRDVWEAIVKLGWLSGCPYQKFHLNRN